MIHIPVKWRALNLLAFIIQYSLDRIYGNILCSKLQWFDNSTALLNFIPFGFIFISIEYPINIWMYYALYNVRYLAVKGHKAIKYAFDILYGFCWLSSNLLCTYASVLLDYNMKMRAHYIIWELCQRIWILAEMPLFRCTCGSNISSFIKKQDLDLSYNGTQGRVGARSYHQHAYYCFWELAPFKN